MSLLQIYENKLSDEFKSFLDQIRTNIETYTEAKHKAQIERMMIIGKKMTQIIYVRSMFTQERIFRGTALDIASSRCV